MEDRHRRGKALKAWRREHDVTLKGLALQLGDSQGGQIAKFESGTRDLPLALALTVSRETKIPLETLLSAEQFALARNVFAVLARDAAA